MLLPTRLAQDEALRALADIRSAVQRTARYSTFSALSGFVAGTAAVLGSGGFGYKSDFAGARPEQGLPFVTVWVGVLAVALVALFVLTWMKARQRGEPLWTPIARTVLAALAGPGAAGVIGSAIFIATGRFELLAGVWLLLYGCGLWALSFFAPAFFRILGAAFVALGAAAWALPEQSGLWLGLGFGVLHWVFGAIVVARYQR